MPHNDYLQHHGVLGMKWGVRRYQNYDGSYTQAGLARYKKAEARYDSAKAAGSKTRMNAAKTDMKSAYNKLADAKRVDEGKKLHESGKTISGNLRVNKIASTSIVFGSVAAAKALYTFGHTPAAAIGVNTAIIGGSAAAAIVSAKTKSDNSKLLAYYSR